MNKEQATKLQQVYRAILQVEQDYQQKYGLSLNDAVAVCHLYDRKEMTSGDFMEALDMSQSNASKVVARIEKAGLVDRTIGKEDKRLMLFKLNAKGRAVAKKIVECDIAAPKILWPLFPEEAEKRVVE